MPKRNARTPSLLSVHLSDGWRNRHENNWKKKKPSAEAEGREEIKMSKMSELSQVLDDLAACGEGLIRTTNAIREIFSAAPAAARETSVLGKR